MDMQLWKTVLFVMRNMKLISSRILDSRWQELNGACETQSTIQLDLKMRYMALSWFGQIMPLLFLFSLGLKYFLTLEDVKLVI